MAQRTGRVTCPRCGTNNFDTVSVCWKCQLPLQQAGVASPPAGMHSGAGMSSLPGLPQVSAVERGSPALPLYSPPPATGDFGVAKRAAIAFALTLPFISLPVGWTFMMIEDHRRQAIGRICVIWSCVALFFHLLLMFVAAQSLTPLLQTLVTTATKAAASQQGAGAGNGSGM